MEEETLSLTPDGALENSFTTGASKCHCKHMLLHMKLL